LTASTLNHHATLTSYSWLHYSALVWLNLYHNQNFW